MITEIQTKLDMSTPLRIDEITWNGAALLIKGDEWHFNAVTSWRAFQDFKYICGSDDDTNLNSIVDLLAKAVLVDVKSQTPSFPVDPTLYFESGIILEVFSDAGYDTWTFGIPNEPWYDFASHDVIYEASKTRNNFHKVTKFLPLQMRKISFNQSLLFIQGDSWYLKISCSWRVIDDKSYVYGCTDMSSYDIFQKLQDLSIVSVHNQSDYFPKDPVFCFSNGYRLEIFSAKRSEPWSMQIPDGTLLGAEII